MKNTFKKLLAAFVVIAMTAGLLPAYAAEENDEDLAPCQVIDAPESSELAGLSVSGGEMLPAFDPKQKVYRIQVEEDTEHITVKAEAPGSKITINGENSTQLNVKLDLGKNMITVESEVIGREKETYTIRVIRGDYLKQIEETANNITKSYEYTAQAWRILDNVFHVGREAAKINRATYEDTVKEAINAESISLGTLATHVLVLTAMGDDARAFETDDGVVNLVEMLATNSGYQYDGIIDAYSTATALYAMLPYTPESDDAWTKERMAKALVDAQYQDGSWGFDGVTGDVDVTAMVLTALAPLDEDESIKASIERGIEYLSKIQQENGGYSSWGANNSNSAEMVLIALCANGVDAATDSRFLKNGYNLLDALLSFVTEQNSGFGFTDNNYNAYATEQGLRAFATYLKFAKEKKPVSPYIFNDMNSEVSDKSDGDANLIVLTAEGENLSPSFDAAITEYFTTTYESQIAVNALASEGASVQVSQTSLSVGENEIIVTVTAKNGNTKEYTIKVTRKNNSSSPSETKKVYVAIAGYNGKSILSAQTITLVDGDTPYSVLARIANKEGIALETSGSGDSIYVVAIGDLGELDYGAESGWMYSVNGEYVQESAGTYKLSDGDTLVWAYTASLGADIAGGSGSIYYNKPEQEESENIKSNNTIDMKVISDKENLSIWEAYALSIYGNSVPQTYISEIRQEIRKNSGEYRKITDIAANILLISALGYNAESFENINLINTLTNSDRMDKQGTNGPIFALLALDCLNYELDEPNWSRDKLIEAILSAQNQDGGVALTQGEQSNVDITAMALTALAPYTGERISSAKKGMIEYLSNQQKASGGFALYDIENCESSAQVIIALCAQGISLDDPRFIKNGNSVLSAMEAYRKSDGTYSHELNGDSNTIATEQAILALIANEWKTSIYTLKERSFRDEAEISSWAYDAVIASNERGIILGENSCFVPKRVLSRAELAQILVRAFKLDSEGDAEYSDVTADKWYYDAINAISTSGIMVGSTGKFRPEDTITREELAVVISRACKISGDAEISDIERISEWARDGVSAVYDYEIMQGDALGFNPRGTVTREMAAVVCIRALDLVK